jgi:hypothetical protein
MHPYGKKLCPSPLQRFLYFYESESIQKLIKDKKKVERIKPLISLPGILMMFCQLIIRTLLSGLH